MGFIDEIKAKAKADKKTIILPESMDTRTWEAAEKIFKGRSCKPDHFRKPRRS